MSWRMKLYIYAGKQHQRRRDKKLNLAWLINIFFRHSVDYCLEVWVERTLNSRDDVRLR